MQTGSSRSLRSLLWLLLRFGVSGGLLGYLVWRADPRTIWIQWQQADWRLLLLAVVVQLGGIALSSWKWALLLQANQRPQPYRWLLATSFLGLFANNFLPTSVGGDAMRVVALGRKSGSYAQASASVFMERLTGLLALSLIALGALLVGASALVARQPVTEPTLITATAGFALVALVATGGAFAAPWLLRRFGHWLPVLVRQPLSTIAQALDEYRHSRGTLLAVLMISLLVHALWIGMHVIASRALGIEAAWLLYLLMVPLTDIIGMVPIFFNNVGARDLVFTLYLRQAGVPDATALALAFTVFSIRLLISLIGGVVLLVRSTK
ncbi:lysylphosphatidylglycerol synthase transmembrane domain-containing protein [Candidatus Chloroploca sp. Khr17]|uniref:lysylphosphatidylglycerol synthase transmembrane domain-containing protein n=1 Tax=Candidatus Chloroploca sp. Khr17 TaxID=2496869 RepID=UPI00101D0773|nr:lysylphosphatidylglycerol synthase transmembrane domain-containing protein [Candidatus Chloroploca sp. Khr17]